MKHSPEITKYFQILSPDYPEFIDRYIQTEAMQRLSPIGQFCGCDYTKLHNIKYWYSRLDHSIACALIVWNFTQDKAQTLASLFHDLGTPVFSHCIDYLFGDTMDQKSSEKTVLDILLGSKDIETLLDADKLTIDDVAHVERYTIAENKKPKLCADRLEGVFHTGLIWHGFWGLSDIEKVYENIEILENESSEDELGFKNEELALKFFEGVYKYGIALQSNEDKFTMQFIADTLKQIVKARKLSIDDFYRLSEAEIISRINQVSEISRRWKTFANATKLLRSDTQPDADYYVSVDCKKRFVNPLCTVSGGGGSARLTEISTTARNLHDQFMNFQDSKYSYLEF